MESAFQVLLSVWNSVIGSWPTVVQFLIIVGAFYLFGRGTAYLIRLGLKRSKIHRVVIELTLDGYRLLIVILGILIGMRQFGVNVTAAFAGLGIAGIAVGFAAKDTLANIISGITIFWDKPFRVGEYITIAEHYGQVVQLTMRSTRIRTRRNQYVVVPNQDVVNHTLINHSKQGEIRVDIPFLIAYEGSIDKTRNTLKGIHKTDTRLSTMRDIPWEVVIDGPDESGIRCKYRIWIADASHERRVWYDYNEKVIKALQKAKIEIPYPRLKVLMNGRRKF